METSCLKRIVGTRAAPVCLSLVCAAVQLLNIYSGLLRTSLWAPAQTARKAFPRWLKALISDTEISSCSPAASASGTSGYPTLSVLQAKTLVSALLPLSCRLHVHTLSCHFNFRNNDFLL